MDQAPPQNEALLEWIVHEEYMHVQLLRSVPMLHPVLSLTTALMWQRN